MTNREVVVGLIKAGHLAIRGTFGQVSEYLDVIEFTGMQTVQKNESFVAMIDLADIQDKHILDFSETYLDTDKSGLYLANIIEKGDRYRGDAMHPLLLSDGTVEDISQFVSKNRPGKNESKLKKGDSVDFSKAIYKGYIITTYNLTKAPDGLAVGTVVASRNKMITINFKKSEDGTEDRTIVLENSLVEKIVRYCRNFERLIYHCTESKIRYILPEDKLYMKVIDDGKRVQYIDVKRLSAFDGKYWDEELRAKYCYEIKIRKFLGTMFPELTQPQIDNLMGLSGMIDIKPTIYSGEDVKKVFVRENISKLNKSSNLNKSCMLDKSSNYFDVYAKNCKALTLQDGESKIIARAMMWEIEHIETGTKELFIDRIYSAKDSLVESIKSYAENKGIVYLARQSYCTTRAIKNVTFSLQSFINTSFFANAFAPMHPISSSTVNTKFTVSA